MAADVRGSRAGTPLVGRGDELDQLTAVVGAARVVTLVGGRGVGKSAIAEALADELGDATIVPLHELAPGTPVAPAVAAACGVREQAGQSVLASLAIGLSSRDQLVVLDGADDVRDAVAPIVDQLRIECPRLSLVVTARTPVRYRHEIVVPVAPLDDASGRELARVHAGAAVSDRDLDAIVAGAGGNALALVLRSRAAARGAPVATGDDPVDAAIVGTIGQLDPAARDALALLTVLPAGASGDALADRDACDALVEAGLAVADSSPPTTRFGVIGAVRAAATRSLVLEAALRSRAVLLQSAVDALGDVLTPSDERRVLDSLERELPNIAAAVAWACDEGHDPAGGARLALGAARVCIARARFDEGTRLVTSARQVDTPDRGRLTYYAGAFAQMAGRLADAAIAFDETEALGRATGDDGVRALGLAGRAAVAFFTGDRAAAASLAADATDLAASSGDDVARMNVASLRATLARIGGDLDAADAAYAETVATARAARDHRSLATALLGHGSVAQLRGALDDANARLVEAREVAEAAGHPAQLAAALGTLGALAEARGDLTTSRQLLGDALAAAAGAGEHRTRLETLVNLGGCEIDLGDHAAARAHLGDALALARRLADRRLAAFALAGLAECALAVGDVAGAARLEREALVSRRDLGDRRALALGLEETAAIVAAADRLDDAPLLLAGADAIRVGAGLARSASEQARVTRIASVATATMPIVEVETAVDRALALLDEVAGDGSRRRASPAERPPPVAPGVAVRTLGGFAVEIDGVPVPPETWGSRRARQLVKLLVAARGRPVPREQLVATLWPDAAPEEEPRLGARLSVLLSTVRKTMGPGAVTGDRAAVAIDLTNVAVDVERLFEAVAGDRHDEVVERYVGDFLPEDIYEEWTAGVREQARLGFLTAARRLARASAAAATHERAAELCLRTLDADPYDDDAHRLLVASLARSGRPGEADRAYQQYAARMNELGLEPPPYGELAGTLDSPVVAVRR